MIPVATGVRIWIATGHTDMRKGMQGLALLVQEGLGRDPFAGDVFVFRGRAGSLIKALWHDGVGLSLYDREFVAAEIFPDVFNRIEFRSIGWQTHKRDVFRDRERGGNMIAGAIEDESGMATRRYLSADSSKM